MVSARGRDNSSERARCSSAKACQPASWPPPYGEPCRDAPSRAIFDLRENQIGIRIIRPLDAPASDEHLRAVVAPICRPSASSPRTLQSLLIRLQTRHLKPQAVAHLFQRCFSRIPIITGGGQGLLSAHVVPVDTSRYRSRASSPTTWLWRPATTSLISLWYDAFRDVLSGPPSEPLPPTPPPLPCAAAPPVRSARDGTRSV